jgi:hypothetical protein
VRVPVWITQETIMNNVRRILITLALVVNITGCTLGLFPRESHDPALAAIPPCYSGDICAVTGAGFAWLGDVMQSTTR